MTDSLLTAERPYGEPDDHAAWAPRQQDGPGPRTHPDGLVDEQRRRRRRAEADADAAEAFAAEAASRASAAIAEAARAAAEAEAAADLAGRAAEEAEIAAAAERRAVQHAHAASAATANETTAVGMAPVVAPVAPVVPVVPAPARTDGTEPGGRPADAAATSRHQAVAAPVGPMSAATTTFPPATGGRASRRRAQEAAAAVALEANRDPVTEVFTPEDDAEQAPTRRSRRAGADTDEKSSAGLAALVAKIRGGRVLLPLAAAGGVIAVAAVVVSVVGGGSGTPSPAAVTESASPSVAAAGQTATDEARPIDAGDADADPTSTKAVAYLAALRDADVPTSSSGKAETEAAAVICQQLDRGTAAKDLARALPAVLPSINSKQSVKLVTIAQKQYC